MSGREKIIIKEYVPRWQTLFEAERDELMEAIGHYVADIQHVGSTAVPGLASKPVVDIMVGLRRLLDAQDCILPIEAMGYEYLPELELEKGFEDRRYFRKSKNGIRTHQIHVVEVNSEFWKRTLLFRDHLRANPISANEYAVLKKELAKKFENDREGYTNAKTDFIKGVLASHGK